MSRKGNSTADVTIHSSQDMKLSFCDVTCAIDAVRSENISVRFEGSRCTIYSGLTAFLPPREGKSSQGWKIDGIHFTRLYTRTHLHVHRHVFQHTHIFASMSRSACTQSRGFTLSQVFCTRTFLRVTAARVFKNSRLQTRFCCSYVRTFVARTRIAEISEE